MKIQFNHKEIDLVEAALLLGMILPAVVKGSRDQGESLPELTEQLAELAAHAWDQLEAAEKEV